jgi:MFS family permease
MFSALRNRNYRYFFSGQFVSLIGTWTRTAALGWITFQFTHSEFLLGIVFMLNGLPLFLFAIYAGALADRIPKIKIFIFTSWFSLLSSLVLALMLFHGPVHIAYLMVFSVLWGVSIAFEMPARQTMMVELVGKKDLVNAIALNSAMVNSARIIGPAVGGILLAYFGAAWCFMLDAFSYLAVLYALHNIKLSASHYRVRKGKTDWKYTLEGFKYLNTNSTIAKTVSLMCIIGLGGWAYQSQLSAFVVTQLKLDAQGARLVHVRILYVGAAVYGTAIILFGFMHQAIGAGALLFLAGFGIILFYSIGNSLIQTQSPDHLRGRLMGIWSLVFGGSTPVGSFFLGLLAVHTSSGFSLQIGGLACIVGTLLVYSAFRK